MVVCSADDETTSPSLESILEDTASDLFKEFTAYLHRSYCIENLEFWLAAQEYDDNLDNHEQLAEKMINRYIKPNSPQEINIPCEMRQKILELYKHRDFHSHLFNDAAEAVLELMRVNSFLPWIQHNYSSSTNSSSPPSCKWTLGKLSRRSCSSLEYDVVDFSLEPSVNSGTRYKSMLKRVKKSLLGQSTENSNRKSNDSLLDTFFTPRSSLNETTFWKNKC